MQSSAVRLTPAGAKALRESHVDGGAVAAEHRRILSLVAYQGHSEVIRAFLRRYPDSRIDAWLGELERLGLVERVPEAPEAALRFTGLAAAPVPALLEEDEKRLADEAWAASNVLSAAGAYVARARAENRSGAAKPPRETTVLVVEDDPDQLALAAQRLAAAGYRVRHADSAKALLESLTADALPDLVLLDVVLPDGDGFDILGNLRRHPRFCLLPVVMLTVKAEPADVRAGIALGADGYMSKPYSAELLARTIAQVLNAGAS